jgi:CRISPR-associated protein Csb1
MSAPAQFDTYLDGTGPAALVLRDELTPAEGPEGVFFPPTYAATEDGRFKGGYNIDEAPGGENVCLIDSVGAQANRLEPMFGRAPYAELVPQISVKAGDQTVSLLEAGHRAGDAIVRCSSLQEQLQQAFKALLKGDATLLANVAPTSLVFGVWDSRDTQAKAPRLLASTIRAHNVHTLTRSAQYVPATDYVGQGLLDEATDKSTKDAYGKRGFQHVPASASHGGVIARGGIRREASLSLAALRLLSAGDSADRARALQRYVFGLALTAFTANPSGYLRQGCNLVLDASKPQPRRVEEVYPSGERKPFGVSHEQALTYAKEAARAYGVGESRTVEFDRERAKRDLTEGGEKKTKGKKAKA